MGEINRAQVILEDYNFWPGEKTFYETQRFRDSAASFRFGSHRQHTSFTIVIDEVTFAAANEE